MNSTSGSLSTFRFSLSPQFFFELLPILCFFSICLPAALGTIPLDVVSVSYIKRAIENQKQGRGASWDFISDYGKGLRKVWSYPTTLSAAFSLNLVLQRPRQFFFEKAEVIVLTLQEFLEAYFHFFNTLLSLGNLQKKVLLELSSSITSENIKWRCLYWKEVTIN